MIDDLGEIDFMFAANCSVCPRSQSLLAWCKSSMFGRLPTSPAVRRVHTPGFCDELFAANRSGCELSQPAPARCTSLVGYSCKSSMFGRLPTSPAARSMHTPRFCDEFLGMYGICMNAAEETAYTTDNSAPTIARIALPLAHAASIR